MCFLDARNAIAYYNSRSRCIISEAGNDIGQTLGHRTDPRPSERPSAPPPLATVSNHPPPDSEENMEKGSEHEHASSEASQGEVGEVDPYLPGKDQIEFRNLLLRRAE